MTPLSASAEKIKQRRSSTRSEQPRQRSAEGGHSYFSKRYAGASSPLTNHKHQTQNRPARFLESLIHKRRALHQSIELLRTPPPKIFRVGHLQQDRLSRLRFDVRHAVLTNV